MGIQDSCVLHSIRKIIIVSSHGFYFIINIQQKDQERGPLDKHIQKRKDIEIGGDLPRSGWPIQTSFCDVGSTNLNLNCAVSLFKCS